MATSPEYPDLQWVPPKSWTDANRTSVQLVVIHTTEGSAHGQSAEDGAAYDARRTDGTSTHYFHDSNSTVQCVRTADQAHAARAQGNRRGIQHELCTRAAKADWDDTYHAALLAVAAKQAARDAKKWGIPIRHLTVAEVAAGEKGFCGHWDVTRAFPQDGGDHTDPGAGFAWTTFLDLVRAEDDDMPTADEIAAAVAKKLDTAPIRNSRTLGGTLDAIATLKLDVIPNPVQRPDAATNPTTTVFFAQGDQWRLAYENAEAVAALRTEVAELKGQVATLAAKGPLSLPADFAAQVADVIAARLKS